MFDAYHMKLVMKVTLGKHIVYYIPYKISITLLNAKDVSAIWPMINVSDTVREHQYSKLFVN
jgi:hypothetical protein